MFQVDESAGQRILVWVKKIMQSHDDSEGWHILKRAMESTRQELPFKALPVAQRLHGRSVKQVTQLTSWRLLDCSPDQVSGAASHVAPPPVTSRSRTSATQTGYPTDEIYPSAHGTSFQNPGHSTLHPFYDPHPDQFSAALENAFPYLHTPQNGSTSFIAGSTTQGLALANPSSHFPHSSYSELVNYAGKYRPAGNASGAAPSTGMGHAAPLASYTERNLTSNRRASVAEPFAKSQKRKSRKSATDVSASAAAKDELGNESREELARKKKKADQQRGYREMDKGAIKELEDILPDGYKVYESRRNRKTITRGK
ncbi:hypothetical protein DENSPDRAFT_914435 [Dentipellis sp. KUC8613]|nr:hypothetical protein DENSPDRAFT_914435 [Dentipellis sp. KUC8613]